MIGLKAALFFLAAPGTVCGLIPWLLTRWAPFDQMDFVTGRWPGLAIMVLGGGGLVWCFCDFVRKGKGTPNPYDAPKKLVTNGLYRVSRNPMYVAILVVIVGEAQFFQRLILFAWGAVAWFVFHLRVLLHEEPALERLFGDQWAQYRASVRRWL